MKLRLLADGTWFDDEGKRQVLNHVVLAEIERLRAERDSLRQELQGVLQMIGEDPEKEAAGE